MASKMLFLLVVTLFSGALAALDEDEIKELPGWEGPLPSKQYSGYLQVPGDRGNKYYHYWFVESEGNPATDPVALWLNGGPGSSSLVGFFTENGPFMLDLASLNTTGKDSVPKLFHRETGWQKAASYIFLESPAGVGFSYCDYDGCTANDTSTAVDNHNVLKAFFKGFPEYSKNEFFITGESYAGIYVPTLAEQIMNDANNEINLVGMAVGNGCWGSQVGLCAFGADMARINVQFLYGHGAISATLYKNISAECGDPALGPGTWKEPVSAACQDGINRMHQMSGNFEIYDYYDTCYGTHGIQMTAEDRAAHIADVKAGAPFGAGANAPRTRVGGAVNDYPCGGQEAMSAYLSEQSVVEALHVKAGTKGMNYGPRDRGDLRPLYATLAQKYRLVIYSGDVDGCVPFVGTEEWTKGLGFKKLEEWRAWQAGTNQNASVRINAGYVTTYEAKPNHNFTFLTVKGAGHMVPEFKPVAALQFLERFFKNEPF
eukprot:m.19801 g.19801  ORF g.19801 m.19801 type:complete len:487 (-) comp6676_c0_seq2:269-1729(-)